MLDIRKGAILHTLGSQNEPSSPRDLFTFVGGNKKSRDPSLPEDIATFRSVISKDLGDLTISYKKTFGSKGVRTLRETVDSKIFTKGKDKADPANSCYAGQEYSVPLGMYFMRSALLHSSLGLDEGMKDSLCLAMYDDIISGPTRIHFNDMAESDSDKEEYKLFPPQDLINQVCDENIEKLVGRPLSPTEENSEEFIIS